MGMISYNQIKPCGVESNGNTDLSDTQHRLLIELWSGLRHISPDHNRKNIRSQELSDFPRFCRTI